MTIEGVSEDASHPVQKAWLEEKVSQCGYCQPGQIMNAVALLKKTPKPTDDDTNAKSITGVKNVVPVDDSRIAVVAENSWAAIQGRNALKITWDEGSSATLDSQQMVDDSISRLHKTTKSDMLEAI